SALAVRLHELAQRLNVTFVAGLSIILLLLVGSFIVPSLSGYDPREANLSDALVGPNSSHPFGTDESGLDILTRVFTAPRVDLPLAAAGVGLALLAGVSIGLFAGFSRGLFSEITMRIADLIQAFPLFVLAIALVA